ncbi:MAG: asparagine synthase (glutamine-hydrolyzing) [Candidatus Obscuribacterales bacterium]|nr:asparagine synthase (glutamine-hydrolyzing) [Candidatus Obscuribacterales bacterium]
MCGIAGFFNSERYPGEHETIVRDMLSTILFRGPDEIGYYINDTVGFGTTRLSIIDLSTGSQPICDETERYWIAYNGEVYNYVELRRELEACGRKFRTGSDTEVVLQAWIEWGFDSLARFNGGYAFCIYDAQENSIVLVRDRFGKRPLFYAKTGETVLFASEMKAFGSWPGWSYSWDAAALQTVFSCWTPLPSDGCYQDVKQVLPGCCVFVSGAKIEQKRYWQPDLSPRPFTGTKREAEEQIRNLLTESVRLRLRSDVEVGTYLSGGIDSAIVTKLAQNFTDKQIHTFSVAFESDEFDESGYQTRLSESLGTRHHVVKVVQDDIARNFPAALDHCEIPVFRTAFVPLFMLSNAVQKAGIKVVLTGEGADECFLGYDIFKEAHLLRSWSEMSAPDRGEFISGMYPYLKHFTAANARFLVPIYERHADDSMRWSLSHSLRFANSALSARLLRTGVGGEERLLQHMQSEHHGFFQWDAVQRGQMLEFETLLSGYLLSSQGDRSTLGNSVENRCPFLDYRVLEFAASLPLSMRLENGLKEKQILKDAFASMLPSEISARSKQPYRAPDAVSFLASTAKFDYIDDALSADELRKIDVLDQDTCLRFVELMRSKAHDKISQSENQAFVLLLSLSLLNYALVRHGRDFRNARVHSVPCTVYDRRSSGARIRA